MNLTPNEQAMEKETTNETTTTTPAASETAPQAAEPTVADVEHDHSSEEEAPETAAEVISEDPVSLPPEQQQYQALIQMSDSEIAKMSCPEITDKVVLLLQSGELPPRSVVDRYKNAFYSKMNGYLSKVSEENASLRAEAEAQEIRLKEILNEFKELNRKRQEALAEEQKANLEVKRGLVERLRKLLGSEDDFNVIKNEYREITDAWRATGQVPAGDMRQLHGEYEHLTEQFYDLRQINNEFREYDFKKNLEAKQALIARAQELVESPETIQAARELQELHRRWRDIGPVAKEFRKDIWKQFQELSALINTNNQEYHEQRRNQEGANEETKRRIIEQIESINPNEIETLQDWQKYTDQIKELQTRWRQTGRVAHAVSEELYMHFRAACDIFFDRRKEFMRDRNKVINDQANRKREIIEELEQIAQTGVWPEAHNRIQELQAEWRTLIRTNKHQHLYDKFRAACDAFYERHKETRKQQQQESKDNVALAKQMIARAHELAAIEAPSESEREEAQTIQSEFRQIGFIPRGVRNKLFDELKEQMDVFFAKFKGQGRSEHGRGRGSRPNRGGGRMPQSPFGEEYDSLQRRKEELQQQLLTYNANKDRLNVASSAGEKLLKDMEARCDKMQQEIDRIDTKLREIRKEQTTKQQEDKE